MCSDERESRTMFMPRRWSSADQPPGMRIHVEPALPRKADKRDPGIPGKLHGKGGGRAHRHHERDARGGRLLDQLEPRPAAEDKGPSGGRDAAAKGRADHLVHRIVPTDVLTDDERLARLVKKPRPMAAARHEKETPKL